MSNLCKPRYPYMAVYKNDYKLEVIFINRNSCIITRKNPGWVLGEKCYILEKDFVKVNSNKPRKK